MQKVKNIHNINDLYKIISFKVNCDDKTGQIRECLKIEDISSKCSDEYCIKVTADYEIEIAKSALIYMVIETIAPRTDVFFTNYITKPCKEYDIIFVIDNDDYRVNGYIFGLVDDSKSRLVEGKLGNGLELGFRDWILPGDGVVFRNQQIGIVLCRAEEKINNMHKSGVLLNIIVGKIKRTYTCEERFNILIVKCFGTRRA
jgi:hypothetical protein